VSVVIDYGLLTVIVALIYPIYKLRVIYLTMGISTNHSLKMVVVALFVALTFAVAGLVGVALLTESVVAQNETGGNETGGNTTGTANTSAFSGGAGMAPATKP
jgi:hypothetical protein